MDLVRGKLHLQNADPPNQQIQTQNRQSLLGPQRNARTRPGKNNHNPRLETTTSGSNAGRRPQRRLYKLHGVQASLDRNIWYVESGPNRRGLRVPPTHTKTETPPKKK